MAKAAELRSAIDHIKELCVREREQKTLVIVCAPTCSGKSHVLKNGLQADLEGHFGKFKTIDSDLFKRLLFKDGAIHTPQNPDEVDPDAKTYKALDEATKKDLKRKTILEFLVKDDKNILFNTRANDPDFFRTFCEAAKKEGYNIIAISPQRNVKEALASSPKQCRDKGKKIDLDRVSNEHSTFAKNFTSFVANNLFDYAFVIDNGLTDNELSQGMVVADLQKDPLKLKFHSHQSEISFNEKLPQGKAPSL